MTTPAPLQTAGSVFQSTLRVLLRAYPKWLLVTLCILGPFLVVEGLFNVDNQALYTQLLTSATTPAAAWQLISQRMGDVVLSVVFALLNGLVMGPLLYGTTLSAVLNPGQSGWRAFVRSVRRWPAVAGTDVLRGVVYFVATVISFCLVILIGYLFQALGFNRPSVTTALVILSVTAVCILVWLAMKLAFVPSVTFVEGVAFRAALRRSAAYAEGRVGLMVRFFILIEIIVFVVSMLFGALSGASNAPLWVTLITDVGVVLVTPLQNVAMAVLYRNLVRPTQTGEDDTV
ncbi:MAG: hypothetical protein K6T78_14990 [Alicyclobacillus sp.]|nr:hypothetical protein [Alicyclobacillus sp.]